MRIATVMLFGFGLGLVLGIPAAFLKKAMITFYRIYSGVCLSVIGLVLAFRWTLNIVAMDLQGPVILKRVVAFLGVALGSVYLPFIAGYGVSVWIISKFFRP